MNTENQISLFDNESDMAMYKHKLTLEKIKNELINFGLTKSQAKVFIYLGKYGSKTASEIAKALQLPRTETYHLVNSLQNIGLVVAELAHPTKYTALEMKEAISTLVNQEQERIDNLAHKEESISELWKEIPFFAVETDESKSEKMQLLHGTGPITNKIKEKIKQSKFEYSGESPFFSIAPKGSSEGDLFYNSNTNTLQRYVNGTWLDISGVGGPPSPRR